MPLKINLQSDPMQFYIFGDALDMNKSFVYYHGIIKYLGIFSEEEFTKLVAKHPMPH
jgi:hypothetical protein